MARKLQIKRGLQARLPRLSEGELGLTTDEKKLYVGHSAGNIQVATEADITEVNLGLNEVMYDRGYASSPSIQNIDANSLTKNGKYFVDSGSCTNMPDKTGWFLVDVIDGSSGGYIRQIASQFGGLGTYIRYCYPTSIVTWTPWREIATMDTINTLILDHSLYLYVDANLGNDTTGDGTPAAPFKTINKALSVIPASTACYDASITINAGTYNENIIITGKQNVLIGCGAGDVNINGIVKVISGHLRISIYDGKLAISHSLESILGGYLMLNIENGIDCGQIITDNSNLYINTTNLKVKGNTRNTGVYSHGIGGIFLWATVGFVVEDCNIGVAVNSGLIRILAHPTFTNVISKIYKQGGGQILTDGGIDLT